MIEKQHQFTGHLTCTKVKGPLVNVVIYLLKPDDPHAIKRHDVVQINDHLFYVKEYDGTSGSLNPVGEPKKELRTGPVYIDLEFSSVNKA